MKSNATVLYHAEDFDGVFCREIARKFLPQDTVFIGYSHGDAPVAVPPHGDIYVLDLPPSCLALPIHIGECCDVYSRIRWIDHHKTAIEKFPPAIPGYRMVDVSACRLAWHYFWHYQRGLAGEPLATLATLDDFVHRRVQEPLAVTLAGVYDVHETESPLWAQAETLQHGLRSRKLTQSDWDMLLSMNRKLQFHELERLAEAGYKDVLASDGTSLPSIVYELLERGAVLEQAREQWYAEIIKQQGFDLEWEGLLFLACNSHGADIRSHLFAAGLQERHVACCGFTWAGPMKGWRISLYHAPGHEDIDLSAIAVKHGGGGHAGACGMHCATLPFQLPQRETA